MNEVRIDRRDTASAPPTEASRHPLLARHHTHEGLLFPGRLSFLHLRDAGLVGLYSDIGVVFPGFDPGIQWFTVIWGDHDDNILALHLDESVTGPLPRIPHTGIVPLGEHVQGLREFKIEGSIAERLGLVLIGDANDYRIENRRGVVREVAIHDTCSWWIRPVDEDLLRAMVRQQLALHEEYLECPGELMAYVEPLTELLRDGHELKLKSLPLGLLRVTYGPKRLFGRRSVFWKPVDTPSPGPRVG